MTDYKEQFNDAAFSNKIHKLLVDSCYKCETTASDADGYSHLIHFKNEVQYGYIHTDRGKIVWIDASSVGVQPEVSLPSRAWKSVKDVSRYMHQNPILLYTPKREFETDDKIVKGWYDWKDDSFHSAELNDEEIVEFTHWQEMPKSPEV